jgi:predicted permease
MRSGLVVAQVALSIVLLLGAGLLMRTFVRLAGVDWGFNPGNVLAANLSFPPGPSTSPVEMAQVYRLIVERMGGISGVRSAALASGIAPFGGGVSEIQIPGRTVPPGSTTRVMFSSERIVETIGASLAAGRSMTAQEVEQARRVALVNEAFVNTYGGPPNPVGETIRLERLAKLPVPVSDPSFEIVGVIRDVANQGPSTPPVPQVFIPFTLRGPAPLTLLLRTVDEPMRLVNTVRREIQLVNRDVAVNQPISMETWIQQVFYARPRFSLLVLGIFAASGIVLVAFGIYGVLAYTVSQQTREIAIRMALGGDRAHVVRMVLRLGLRLVCGGLIAGLAASLATNRLLVSQLWNTSATDPLTFGVVIGVILLVGLIACWVPARRAVRVEPMVALRHE